MGGNSAAANSSAFSAGGYIGPTTSLGAAGGSDLIPAPMGTGNAIGSTSYTYGGTSWEEFCDRHARVAATDFTKACINYINGNLPPEEARNIPHRSFALKFVESFVEYYDTEFFRRRSNLKTGVGSLFPAEGGTGGDSFDTEEHEVSRLFPKSLLRRLSFKGLRKGKKLFFLQAFFHKNSDDVDGVGSSKQSGKTKLAKIVVECRKEGIVNNLTAESLDQTTGTQKWERCRLALVKAVGGYMLEFYTPPKSTKPRSGVFCFLISEARETTTLEMPDRNNTFVLKADNNMEYVIEAGSQEDMRSWLATIRYCMRTPPTQQPMLDSDVIAAAMQTSPVTANPNPTGTGSALGGIQNPQYQQQGGLGLGGSNGNLVSSQSADSGLVAATAGSSNANVAASSHDVNAASLSTSQLNNEHNAAPPEIPSRPQRGERGEQRLSASSNFDGNELLESESDVNVADLTAELRQFPWFHGTLPRAEAARMVLQSEADGHGYFLVRQSETRRGEFVLTFNCIARAKHLRLTISEKGQCRVQHLWFPTIQAMLEHFRHNPIPLESGGTSEVTLTEFVHHTSRLNDSSAIGAVAGSSATSSHDSAAGGGAVDAAAAGGAGVGGSGAAGGNANGNSNGHPSPRHCNEVITMNLSVRLKTNEIELPQEPTHVYFPEQVYFHLDPTPLTVHSSPPAGHGFLDQPHLRASNASLQAATSSRHGADSGASGSGGVGGAAGGTGGGASGSGECTGRAIDNQYSFT
ncbi:hypothetical protein KR093_011829 [Drosophila rubida]|uniref:SH2B adapter protein 1 n=1 Tax=Drosophila rubida TaxID=30044 RepID=A0AAD4JX15_9MUSC|nr:hypothetical protein KR093_011829 [Drosophila rubida]